MAKKIGRTKGKRKMVYLFLLGIWTIILLLVFRTTINYKLKANRLGVKISWMQVVAQKMRKTMTDDILEAAGIAIKENLDIDIIQLETHKLATGDPLKVVKEIVEAKNRGQVLEFNVASAYDLIGEDYKGIVRDK